MQNNIYKTWFFLFDSFFCLYLTLTHTYKHLNCVFFKGKTSWRWRCCSAHVQVRRREIVRRESRSDARVRRECGGVGRRSIHCDQADGTRQARAAGEDLDDAARHQEPLADRVWRERDCRRRRSRALHEIHRITRRQAERERTRRAVLAARFEQ